MVHLNYSSSHNSTGPLDWSLSKSRGRGRKPHRRTPPVRLKRGTSEKRNKEKRARRWRSDARSNSQAFAKGLLTVFTRQSPAFVHSLRSCTSLAVVRRRLLYFAS